MALDPKPSSPRTILITGAGSGIGRETARLFASRGWRVAAVDVNAGALAALVVDAGGSITPIVGDVSTRAGADAVVAAATSMTGGTLDCLFNCAGLLEMGPHHTIPRARIDSLIAVNVNGVLNCIDAALPALEATPGAHIVNMSSASAEYGTPELAAYSASKFFVRGLTEALNIEFEPLGIQVSAILVAYVRTPMVTDAQVQAASVAKSGVNVEPTAVAEIVWRAAHGDKVLWRVGRAAVLMHVLVRVLGPWVRGLYKKSSGY